MDDNNPFITDIVINKTEIVGDNNTIAEPGTEFKVIAVDMAKEYYVLVRREDVDDAANAETFTAELKEIKLVEEGNDVVVVEIGGYDAAGGAKQNRKRKGLFRFKKERQSAS